MTGAYRTPFTLYEVPVGPVMINIGGTMVDMSATLHNGRANYVLFQAICGSLTGLHANSEGGDSDLVADNGDGYEVKAFKDVTVHPAPTGANNWIHTAASSTFGANNRGPEIRRLLNAGQYAAAKQICVDTGYRKNAFYVYTNTRGFSSNVPLRYLIVPTETVMQLLDPVDPRRIDRHRLLETVTHTVRITDPVMPAALTL